MSPTSPLTVQQTFELALRHYQAGRLADAEALYRQILAAQPQNADALQRLGVIAGQAGRQDLAVEWLRQAIATNPGDFAAYYNLGETYRTMGRPEEAIASFRRALELKPDLPEAYNNMGIALAEQGRYDEAVAAYRQALQCRPDYPKACNNLGAALAPQGRLDEAVKAHRQALQLKPDYPEACNNLGSVLTDMGAFDEAISAFHRALELQPCYPEACNNLGNALLGQGRLDEALTSYRRALELKPNYPNAWSNLGAALTAQGHLDEAAAACHRALQLEPGSAAAYLNLGNTLKEQGQLADAVAAYRRALQLKPEDPLAHSNLLYALHYLPSHDERTLPEEQQRWNRQFSDPLKPFIRPHHNDRGSERRLRIGYVSPNFREHVVGRYLLPLLEHHDHRNFEILCYSGVVKRDQVTDEFRQYADQWRDTVGVADEALSEMIRGDGVDILVDLAQHLAGNRLPMFAHQPAPVQVSFAGYPASTGLDAIPYRISDRYLESEPSEQVSLIDTFWCYRRSSVDVEIDRLPALASERVTFGCLNNFCKTNETVLKLWARVLREVKGSGLVLQTGAGRHRQRTVEILEREGVEPQRVEFVERCPRRAYLELYHRLDIVLDAFPYNGHTTSLDALWMGVPVVSLAGRSAVSRAGLSQMSNLGLPEFAVFSEDDYVRTAVQLAHDLPRLAELRATLRSRMQASPLMDAPRFAHNIETAYRAMWRRWCAENSSSQS